MKFIWGREVIYNLFPKFHVNHERFSFYGHRKSEEGADSDVICNGNGLSYGMRLLQKTTLGWLAKTKVNMAFDWLSNFLTSDHGSSVFLRNPT